MLCVFLACDVQLSITSGWCDNVHVYKSKKKINAATGIHWNNFICILESRSRSQKWNTRVRSRKVKEFWMAFGLDGHGPLSFKWCIITAMVSLHGQFIRNKNALKEYWNTALSLLCYYREINPVFNIEQHSTGANLEIPFTVHFSHPWLRFVMHCTRLRESWKWKAPGLIPAGCFSIQL